MTLVSSLCEDSSDSPSTNHTDFPFPLGLAFALPLPFPPLGDFPLLPDGVPVCLEDEPLGYLWFSVGWLPLQMLQ